MKKKPSILETLARAVFTVLFVLMGLLQYFFYYKGLDALFGTVLNQLWIILVLLLTYMFRIDALAAAIGFYGAWHELKVPEWEAMGYSALYLVTSIFVNHSAGMHVLDYFKRPQKKVAGLAVEEDDDDEDEEEPVPTARDSKSPPPSASTVAPKTDEKGTSL